MDAKMKEFLVKVSQDEELKNELLEKLGTDAKDATDTIKKVVADVAKFAKEKGFDVGAKTVASNTIKIDDEALDEVAGGRLFLDSNGKIKGDCRCFAGGGGVADSKQDTCACVGGGCGFLTDEGQKWATQNGDSYFIPLFCVLAGTAAHDLAE